MLSDLLRSDARAHRFLVTIFLTFVITLTFSQSAFAAEVNDFEMVIREATDARSVYFSPQDDLIVSWGNRGFTFWDEHNGY